MMTALMIYFFCFAQLIGLIEEWTIQKRYLNVIRWKIGGFYQLIIVARVLLLIGMLNSDLPYISILYLIFWITHLFFWRGNFNGGSDNMSFVILTGIILNRFQSRIDSDGAFLTNIDIGLVYVGFMSIGSYFISGWSKIFKRGWLNGENLKIFINISPAILTEPKHSRFVERLSATLSISMLLFEIGFPIILIIPQLTFLFLIIGFLFHLGVFYFFGLNRFFWTWISTYPAILYLANNFGLQ